MARLEKCLTKFSGAKGEDIVNWCDKARRTFRMLYPTTTHHDKISALYMSCLTGQAATRSNKFMSENPTATLPEFLTHLTETFMNHNTNLERMRWLQKVKQKDNTMAEFENYANELAFLYSLFSELRMKEFINREIEKGSRKWTDFLEILAMGYPIKTDAHFSNPEHQHYFDLGMRAGANKILLHQCDEEMKMQLLAGCTQPVREYILQHGGINQTFKECTDKGILYLRTMDQTNAIDRIRVEDQAKGALAIGGSPKDSKTKTSKRESLKQANERLAKEIDAMRQQFQSMSTPAKQKEERKTVSMTEKQKQERATKRR